jgi:hypothetical protein
LIALVAICAYGQDGDQKVFDAVPEPSRARLIERLKLYVECERTRNYDKLYDLSLESVATPKKFERDAYVEASKKAVAKGYRNVLLQFKPTRIDDLSIADQGVVRYHISGLAKVEDGEKVYEKDAAIEVRWINGDWYFSGLWDVIND